MKWASSRARGSVTATTSVPRSPSSAVTGNMRLNASYPLSRAQLPANDRTSSSRSGQNDPVIQLIGNRDPGTPRFSQCNDPGT